MKKITLVSLVALAILAIPSNSVAQTALIKNHSLKLFVGVDFDPLEKTARVDVSGSLSAGKASKDDCIAQADHSGYSNWWNVALETVPEDTAKIVNGPFAGETISLFVSPGESGVDCTYPGDLSHYAGFRTFSTDQLSPGPHDVRIRVEDELGSSAAVTVSFEIPGTDPSPGGSPPTVDLKINGTNGPANNLKPGDSVTLSWTSTNADFCVAGEGWSGNKPIQSSGVTVGPLNDPGTHSFRIRCTNSAGDDAETVTANVVAPVVPVCSPSPQNKVIGEQVSFSVTPTNDTYTWTASEGSPAGPVNAPGSQGFSTTYSGEGQKTVTVRSTTTNNQSSCTVFITDPTTGVEPLVCDGPKTASTGQNVTFTSTGGSGSYSWTGGGSPPGANTENFTTKWNFPGPKTVQVDRGAATATCEIDVAQAPTGPGGSGCTINVSSNAPTHWQISGPTPNGNFIHSPNYDESVLGATHTTDDSGNLLPSGGATQYTIDIPSEVNGWSNPVVSPGLSQKCGLGQTINFNITYNSAPQNLTCSPPSQSGITGNPVSFVAAGGTGNYSWSAPGGTPNDQDGGANFSTTYGLHGSKIVTLDDGVDTKTCEVAIFTGIPPVVCDGPTQLNVDQDGIFTATGGTGSYTWLASAQGWGEAIPSTGSGPSFTTRFTHQGGGSKVVRVNSGPTRQDTCLVNVTAGATHSECVNNSCVMVGGAGPNRCGANSDCGGGPGGPGDPSFHGVCDSAQRACVNRAGSGGGTCSSDPNCAGVTQSHLECQGSRWVIVGGPGPATPGAMVGGVCVPPGGGTCTFAAAPTLIAKGGSSTLDWSCSGAASCAVTDTLSGAQVGSGGPTGNVVVSPTTTTPYNLNCDSGVFAASTTVRVFSIIEVPPR